MAKTSKSETKSTKVKSPKSDSSPVPKSTKEPVRFAPLQGKQGEPVRKAQGEPQTMEELLASEGYGFKGYKKGQAVHGKVASIAGKEVLIDFGGKTEGIVGEKEWEQVKNFVAQLKVGDPIDAIVISIENNNGQMAVSIRQSGTKFRWQRATDLLSSGEEVKVRGTEVNKGGLIVDFEGVKGFIPSSQLSGEHQGEISKLVNKTLSVKVIEVNQTEGRLIFSEKAVAGGAEVAKKLDEVKKKVKIGQKYTGKVSAIMPYGIFVNLDAGPDGLVHISEISWQKVENIADMFTLGQEVEVQVLGINENDAKLNLSLKQLQPDPWTAMAEKYSAEQQIKGEVTRVSTYGVFVRLEDGIEGLIHISKVPAEADYKPGDAVNCTIESVDAKAHRISLIPVLVSKPIGYK